MQEGLSASIWTAKPAAVSAQSSQTPHSFRWANKTKNSGRPSLFSYFSGLGRFLSCSLLLLFLGVPVHAAGVGKANEQGLREIGSEPHEKHLYFAEECKDMGEMTKKLISSMCLKVRYWRWYLTNKRSFSAPCWSRDRGIQFVKPVSTFSRKDQNWRRQEEVLAHCFLCRQTLR